MAGTRNTEIPDPPEWVKEAGAEAVWAWETNLHWRIDAVVATREEYRRLLITEAKRARWKD